MTPRKRPHCQTCGSPMAGHKRPYGSPVCPVKQPNTSPFNFPLNAGHWHWRNPNFIEPSRPTEADVIDTASFITTEPAESTAGEELRRRLGVPAKGASFEDDTSSTRSVDSFSSSTETIKRGISEILSFTSPLATLFSTRGENVAMVTDTALRHGLHTGVVYSPKRYAGVKSEHDDGSVSRSAELGRRGSFLVVMGQDASAVALTMLGLSKGDAQGQLVRDINNEGDDGQVCMAGVRSFQVTFLNIIVAGAVGGLVVFFGLSMM